MASLGHSELTHCHQPTEYAPMIFLIIALYYVVTWMQILHYWPFVWGIPCLPKTSQLYTIHAIQPTETMPMPASSLLYPKPGHIKVISMNTRHQHNTAPCLTPASWCCKSLSANGSPAFIWKLGCHWLKGFWHLFKALVMLILPDAMTNFLANGSPAFIWKLLYHWSVRQGRCNADSHAQSPSYILLNITCVA